MLIFKLVFFHNLCQHIKVPNRVFGGVMKKLQYNCITFDTIAYILIKDF